MESEPVLISQELKEMYEADQEDRKNWRTSETNWEVVKPRDNARLKRVEKLYSQGLLKNADDIYHAAMIYQHGDKPEHYKKAMELSKKAGGLGHPDGKTFSALAEDRYLLEIGKAQIWGTQFTRENFNEQWRLKEPFDRDARTDEERKEMGLISVDQELRDLNSKN